MYGFGRICENCQDERAHYQSELCKTCIDNELEDLRYEKGTK
jgi:hypothetical protein